MGVSLNNTAIAVKEHDFKSAMRESIPNVDYATHGIHSYTAKLIPHIARHYIGLYTKRDELVLDPFVGSGTTLLEANLLGRNAIGVDINPLAKLISEVKTTPIDIIMLECAVEHVVKGLAETKPVDHVNFPNIDYWFGEKAQKDLARIKSTIEALRVDLEPRIYNFLLVCFSSIIRRSSYADPRIAKTYKSKRMVRKIEDNWYPRPMELFKYALDRNCGRMKNFCKMVNANHSYARVFHGDAREVSSLLQRNGIGKADFIITSPPYINAQDYFRSYKLELYWLGLCTPEQLRLLRQKSIGTESILGFKGDSELEDQVEILGTVCQKISKINPTKSSIVCKYFSNMRLAIEEFNKVLREDGHLCMVTGSNRICGVLVPTYEIIVQMAEARGLKLVELAKDKIRNRRLPPVRNHKAGVIQEEWITVFQKGTNECTDSSCRN